MICRATLSLLAFSSAPWPPRPKIPTRNPVLPKLRVGIISWMALAATGLFCVDGTSPDAEEAITPADKPTAIEAAPVLRKPRRSWSPASCGVSFVFMPLLQVIRNRIPIFLGNYCSGEYIFLFASQSIFCFVFLFLVVFMQLALQSVEGGSECYS